MRRSTKKTKRRKRKCINCINGRKLMMNVWNKMTKRLDIPGGFCYAGLQIKMIAGRQRRISRWVVTVRQARPDFMKDRGGCSGMSGKRADS